MLLKILTLSGLVIATALESVLVLALVQPDIGLPLQIHHRIEWAAIHVFACILAAAVIALYAHRPPGEAKRGRYIPFFTLCFLVALALPLLGVLGVAGSMWYGLKRADERQRLVNYWQLTKNPELPFTTPIGRRVGAYDSRGFVEQLTFDQDTDGLYRKVLAAANVRSSLSVDALKTAVQHQEERVRLTGYQSLDRKITALNLEIQRLEKATEQQQEDEKSNTWLHIASNYWELLTLEKDEPIARRQLLDKAATAAFKSTELNHRNRNAFYTLGRVSLLQGNTSLASRALERAYELGMPRETVVPYLAEVAFKQRNFAQVRELLQSIDSAFRQYPPLRQVAEYWA